MKKTIFLSLLAILAVFFLVSCSPSEDIPRATISEVETKTVTNENIEQNSESITDETSENAESNDPNSNINSLNNLQINNSEATINYNQSSIMFEGFGPGKSHVGTFDKWSAVAFVEDNEIKTIRGSIDPASVNTGIGGLDKHLKSSDFFDVEKYPTITFELNLEEEIASGPVTFHGVTKMINFPVTVNKNSAKAEFVISMKEFDISYVGVNDEVQIWLNISIE